MFKDSLDRFFSKLEWRWSLANFFWSAGAFASATLPAWAVSAMNIFSEYAPLSWVGAGLTGFLLFCFGFFVFAVARERLVRARYNARAMSKGSFANPLEKIFERQRIYLNDFALPSNPYIHDKTFIDCEIIGPCNIFLVTGNRVDEPMPPKCDAAVLPPDTKIFNSYSLTNCSFRRCLFQRITFFVSHEEYQSAKKVEWLNWVTYCPDSELPLLNQLEDHSHRSSEGTKEEMPR